MALDKYHTSTDLRTKQARKDGIGGMGARGRRYSLGPKSPRVLDTGFAEAMTPEERALVAMLAELVDGAKPVVEIMSTGWNNAQQAWKMAWLKKARAALAHPGLIDAPRKV